VPLRIKEMPGNTYGPGQEAAALRACPSGPFAIATPERTETRSGQIPPQRLVREKPGSFPSPGLTWRSSLPRPKFQELPPRSHTGNGTPSGVGQSGQGFDGFYPAQSHWPWEQELVRIDRSPQGSGGPSSDGVPRGRWACSDSSGRGDAKSLPACRLRNSSASLPARSHLVDQTASAGAG